MLEDSVEIQIENLEIKNLIFNKTVKPNQTARIANLMSSLKICIFYLWWISANDSFDCWELGALITYSKQVVHYEYECVEAAMNNNMEQLQNVTNY